MTNDIALQKRKYFDYNAVPEKETRAFLRKRADLGKAILKRTILGIWEMGQLLSEVREKLDHGDFLKWVEVEFDLSRSSAYRFMAVFNGFPDLPEISHRGKFDLAPRVLYALSEAHVDEETRGVALEMAAAGDLKTVADAREIIDAGKPPEKWKKSAPEATPEPQVLEGEVLNETPDPEPDEDAEEAAMSISSEPEFEPEEPQVLATTPAPAAKSEIVYDTLKENAPTVETDLSDEDWLATIGAFRVLRATPNRGIIARRALLSYRAAQKALGALARAWSGCNDAKSLDANDPVASSIGKAARLPHPHGWFLCATCRGRGCSRCGLSGLDPYAGIDPTRVERGEVSLDSEVTP